MSPTTLELTGLLTKRFGSSDLPVLPPNISEKASIVLETLFAHRSVRSYQNVSLPDGTLETLVAAAQSAATSSNLQSWSVVAIEDPVRKAEAARLCADQDFIRQAPLFLLFCADLARLKAISEIEDKPGTGLDYLEMFLTATIDATLAAQNAAIAAESMGLGICYVGSARNAPQELAALIQLPERVFVVFGLAVGVPTIPNTAAIKPRLAQNAVLYRETYSTTDRAQQLADYNEAMAEFNASQGRTTPTWTRLCADRVATIQSLHGRHRLREILQNLGFDLT